MSINACLAFMGLPGGSEIIIIGLIALLLFGARLPKVARSMGKSIVEFKKGIKGVQDEIDESSEESSGPPTDDPSAEAPPIPEGGKGYRHKGDLSNPGDSSSS